MEISQNIQHAYGYILEESTRYLLPQSDKSVSTVIQTVDEEVGEAVEETNISSKKLHPMRSTN